MSAKLSIKKEISVQKKKTSTKSSVIGGNRNYDADDDTRRHDGRHHTKVGSIRKRQTKRKKAPITTKNSNLCRAEGENSDANSESTAQTSHKAVQRRSPRKTATTMKNASPNIFLATLGFKKIFMI